MCTKSYIQAAAGQVAVSRPNQARNRRYQASAAAWQDFAFRPYQGWGGLTPDDEDLLEDVRADLKP